ncbi:Toprim-like [Paenibacillus sp. yr247]|uniref:toprim domain-containing protein n=1 Tax=Paenibacillus sp. yr247 TaxID=1761880 RepID=UPI00087E9861|nr:toprim domain-containing protein [Paenibacillus sp. yr247]SDO18460.1 Toprim-like [Paenibacillus sp. yr247]
MFNSKAFKEAIREVPVFCVESALDAILLKSFGVDAVATNGIFSVGKLIEQVNIARNADLRLMLLFDFDEDGRKATEKVSWELRHLNVIPILPKTLVGPAEYLRGFKDFGEAYRESRSKAEQAIAFLAMMKQISDMPF